MRALAQSSRSTYFAGWCSNPHCRKYGHMWRDCTRPGGGAHRAFRAVSSGAGPRPSDIPLPEALPHTELATRGVQGAILPDVGVSDGSVYERDDEFELLVDSGARTRVMPEEMIR